MRSLHIMNRTLILINPCIYDFAAYDLWSKPLGLLSVAGSLRRWGFNVHLIDCLDVHHGGMMGKGAVKPPKRRLYGTGKFWREPVPRPSPLKDTYRPYSRYGLLPELIEQELRKVRDPRAVLITSLMTYWYPGVTEAVSLARKVHPGVPVIMGGIYARLCRDHATRTSGADRVVSEPGMGPVLKALAECGIDASREPPSGTVPPYPAFDLLTRVQYVCLMTSLGCPYRCQYCASHFLQPVMLKRAPGDVVEEILYWHRDFGVRDFAFYDDALLVDSETHAAVFLERLARRDLNLRFHTPNALHVKEITLDMAGLMRRSGFRTIRLGLETSDISLHRDLDGKIAVGDFERAVRNLFKAGFDRREIGAYILVGLPWQTVDSVRETIDFVGASGVVPHLAEYSPIPHSPMWENAVKSSRYDLTSEPLFHNNTLLPCWDETKRAQIPILKEMISRIREKYRQP